jgi:ATP-dependent protease HslVU (ClpYQ) peptidase subunit
MSADSIIVCGWQDKTPVGNDKLFEVNGMIIGSSGDAQELTHMFLFAENHTPLDMTERGLIKFMNEFRAWRIAEFGVPAEKCVGNQYLIARQGKVFCCLGTNYVGEVKNFYAIGAGEDYAKAALYLGHSPAEAVKVACALSCYVDEPIITKSMPKN